MRKRTRLSHAAGDARRRSRAAANANTARMLSEVRLGKSATICASVMPAARYSRYVLHRDAGTSHTRLAAADPWRHRDQLFPTHGREHKRLAVGRQANHESVRWGPREPHGRADEPAARPASAVSRSRSFARCSPACTPPRGAPIRLSIGEPQHATPELDPPGARRSSRRPVDLSDDGRARSRCARRWPRGSGAATRCRASMPASQVLPVNGTREALFAFAQSRRRRVASGAARRLSEPVLPDLRRRGAARRRRAGVPQSDGRRTGSASISTR